MESTRPNTSFASTLHCRRPDAIAYLSGGGVSGMVRFCQTWAGVLVTAEVEGLPSGGPGTPSIFALHIHAGPSCTGTWREPLADTAGHFNPQQLPHPMHAGDLPPLFGNDGVAFLSVLTNRFRVSDVAGKTIVIHSGPDDFKTQPSGGAGEKIACGVIYLTPVPRT